jgi:hypothetical protein
MKNKSVARISSFLAVAFPVLDGQRAARAFLLAAEL